MKKSEYLEKLNIMQEKMQVAHENINCAYWQNLYYNMLEIEDLATDLRRAAYDIEEV